MFTYIRKPVGPKGARRGCLCLREGRARSGAGGAGPDPAQPPAAEPQRSTAPAGAAPAPLLRPREKGKAPPAGKMEKQVCQEDPRS